MTKPVDFNNPVTSKSPKNDTTLNKIMLNHFDDGRCYDLEPSSDYNLRNLSLKSDLIFISFKRDITCDKMEQVMCRYGTNCHVQKDSKTAMIINLENKDKMESVMQRLR